MCTVIGIDVGGTSIKAARVAADAVIEESVSVATPRAGDEVAAAVRDAAAKVWTDGVVAAGVVVPGALDDDRGIVRYSANLGWRDVPLRALLVDELGVPVVVDNDVSAAALAESTHAAGDLFYVALGTGIGGAHVHDGTVLLGAAGLAGEIGHVPVYPDGEPCACGQRGCLEVYASAGGMARRYVAAGGTAGASARDIAARLDDDPVAARVWRQAAAALGLALASAVLLLDPDRVVLGGGLAQAGDVLLVPVRAEFAGRMGWRAAPPLVRSTFGLDAGVRGAALLAWQLTSDAGKAGYLR